MAALAVVGALAGPVAAAEFSADDVGAALRRSLDRAVEASPAAVPLRQAYQAMGFRPLWTGERASALVRALKQVDVDGLRPAAYDIARLSQRIETPPAVPAAAADLDLQLSRTLIRYAGDVRYGITDPQKVEPEYHVPHTRVVDVTAVLSGAAGAVDMQAYLAGLASQSDDYRALKNALGYYRAIAAAGGWPKVAEGPSLRPQERSERVPALRARLAAERLAPAASEDPELFDAALADGLKTFQSRQGLEPDGVLGVRTARALNTSAEARVDQIVLNMERRRWLDRDLGRLHIIVNLADFSLKLVDGDRTLLESRVIVGTLDNQTPILSARLSHVEFNPYWNVPYSIARKELLPEIQKDLRYLEKKRIRVFARVDGERQEVDPSLIDWRRYNQNNFPFVLRQDPGDINSLGRIKFVIPNRHDIYLHDTPSRGLFRRSLRSFSHGCIRVEKARELADILLQGNRGWTPELVAESLASEERRTLALTRAPIVHLVYLTAWVDSEGVMQFRGDLYGRDRILSQALSRQT